MNTRTIRERDLCGYCFRRAPFQLPGTNTIREQAGRSFTKPLEPGNVVEKDDWGFFTKRTEVRSKLGDSHLGHVFDDGPPPTGLRYCMNSAALRFIPAEDLGKEGYGQYRKLFEKK